MDLIRKAVDLQAERRLHRRFARLGLLPARPVRRSGARARARGVAEAGRSGAQRPSRRRLLARRPPAGSDVPVGHARDLKPEPDVLASVQKKLAEGLPPLEGKTAADPQNVAPAPSGARRAAAGREEERAGRAGRTGGGHATAAAISGRLHGAARPVAVVDRRRQARQRRALPRDPQPQPAAAGDPGRLVPGQELRLPTAQATDRAGPAPRAGMVASCRSSLALDAPTPRL